MSRDENLYVEIWERKYLKWILMSIKKGGGKTTIDRLDFEKAGNRIKTGYSFGLKIVNGKIPSDEGNATSRDLKIVLDKSKEFGELAKEKEIRIKVADHLQELELSVQVKPLTITD